MGKPRKRRVLIADTFEADLVDREIGSGAILKGVARIRASRGVIVLHDPRAMVSRGSSTY